MINLTDQGCAFTTLVQKNFLFYKILKNNEKNNISAFNYFRGFL